MCRAGISAQPASPRVHALAPTTPCYSQFIHSSAQDCQLSSYPEIKPKIHVTANKALVRGPHCLFFISHCTTGLATLSGHTPMCLFQGLCTHCSLHLESVFLRVATGLAPSLHYCLYSKVLSSVRTSCPSNTRLHLCYTLVFSISPLSYIFSKTFIIVK